MQGGNLLLHKVCPLVVCSLAECCTCVHTGVLTVDLYGLTTNMGIKIYRHKCSTFLLQAY